MRRGDLFVLSWESLRRVEWGKVSSFLSMSDRGLFNSLLVARVLFLASFLSVVPLRHASCWTILLRKSALSVSFSLRV